jgi:lipoate-protein ligase A
VAAEIQWLPGYDARAHLAEERRLFDAARRDQGLICLFYVCDPCIVLGSNNSQAEWVHADAARTDGVPLLRRFSGGGTVYLDRDVLNYSFIMPRALLEAACRRADLGALPTTRRYIALCRQIVVGALERWLGAGFSLSGISDISLNGRKLSGNAQRIAADVVLHHGTLLLRCPLGAIERYLPVPPNRRGVSHREFVTGLAEEGLHCTAEKLAGWIESEFTAVFGDSGLNQSAGGKCNPNLTLPDGVR